MISDIPYTRLQPKARALPCAADMTSMMTRPPIASAASRPKPGCCCRQRAEPSFQFLFHCLLPVVSVPIVGRCKSLQRTGIPQPGQYIGRKVCNRFIVGFRLGAKMIFDTFCSDNAPFESYLKD